MTAAAIVAIAALWLLTAKLLVATVIFMRATSAYRSGNPTAGARRYREGLRWAWPMFRGESR